jgi:soluble cytochrome b562/DNA-directed RNA polymerase subunit RPC12/RpoP
MELTKKAAYIKGLCDGLKLSEAADENKVLLEIVKLLEEVCETVDTNTEDIDSIVEELEEMQEELEDIDEELDDVAEELEDFNDTIEEYEEFFDMLAKRMDEEGLDCGCGPDCDCGCNDGEPCTCGCADDDDFDDELDEEYYEVTCGKCGESICFSEDILLEGSIECPNCGEPLEFDFSSLEDDDESELEEIDG